MKECPVCNAKAMGDAEVCHACLRRFDEAAVPEEERAGSEANRRKERSMNKQRRKELNDLKDRLAELKERLEEIEQEEQECLDNMPENFQLGERGEAAEDALYALQEAQGYADEVMGAIDDAIGEA